MSDRLCPACQQPLTRHKGESPSAFKKRQTCGRECANAARGLTREGDKLYPSRYGAGNITPSEWLAEYICERIAIKDRRALTVKFWRQPSWEKIYQWQLVNAKRLLTRFEPAAVSRALRSRRGKCLYSLAMPLVRELASLEQATIDRQRAAPPTPDVEAPATTEQVRPVFVEKPSLVSKLKGL